MKQYILTFSFNTPRGEETNYRIETNDEKLLTEIINKEYLKIYEDLHSPMGYYLSDIESEYNISYEEFINMDNSLKDELLDQAIYCGYQKLETWNDNSEFREEFWNNLPEYKL